MSLGPGTRLGPYEIHSALGAGGMGEVYRARDTRLERDVAIKILPEAFAHDPDRVARFQREAKTLAALNHPNIGGIYGAEEAPTCQHVQREIVRPLIVDPIHQGAQLLGYSHSDRTGHASFTLRLTEPGHPHGCGVYDDRNY